MIIDGLLNLFSSILSPIVNALPVATLPVGVNNSLSAIVTPAQILNGWVPFWPVASFWLHTLAITFFPLLTYRVGVWLYNRARG